MTAQPETLIIHRLIIQDQRFDLKLYQKYQTLALHCLLFVFCLILSHDAAAQKAACSADIIAQICSPVTSTSHTHSVECSVDFSVLDCDDAAVELGSPANNPNNHITRKMRFQGENANDVLFNCAGGSIDSGKKGDILYGHDMVEVRSVLDGASWFRPENITIQNCHIIGGTRVYGMGRNGEAEAVRESSKKANHTQNVRANAPRNITFDNVELTGIKGSALYFGPGVTYSSLINSEVNGHSNKAAIYLDTESMSNTLKNNVFRIHTNDGSPFAGFYDRGWPVLALDGSSHNLIQNNHFLDIAQGGVYMYRNCGEGGTIRHSTPSYNTILNNVFQFVSDFYNDPAIFVGSRDYDSFHENGWPSHCGDDRHSGSPYGSAVSNSDYARHNIIMQNQFVRQIRSRPRPIDTRPGDNDSGGRPGSVHDSSPVYYTKLAHMIRSRDWSDNSPNTIKRNEMVGEGTIDSNRLAGCYLPDDQQTWLEHGESQDTMSSGCYSSFTCRDGDTTRPAVRDCRIDALPFDCQISGNNGWCERTVACPSGTKVVGAKAACNLEYGTIRSYQVEALPFNRLEVLRKSDNTKDGVCYVSFNRISKGKVTLNSIKGWRQLAFGCTEHDNNGGDCHIKGISYCAPSGTGATRVPVPTPIRPGAGVIN